MRIMLKNTVRIMRKERTVAFTDAVLAIIMTILVLDLETPKELTWAGFAELWPQYAAYALTFFWLGALWINLHIEWEHARNVSVPVLWWTIIMLFFASFTPYTTGMAAEHFFSPTVQAIYGVVVMLISLSNLALSWQLQKVNTSTESGLSSKRHRGALWIDLSIKLIGLVLALTVWPPAMMISVVIAGTLVSVALQVQRPSGTAELGAREHSAQK